MTSFFWHKCLKKLQSILPRQQFIQYISPLQIKLTNNKFIILVPNYYILDKITNYYISIIKNVIYGITNKKYNIELKIGSNILEHVCQNKKKIIIKYKNNLNITKTFNTFINSEINKSTILAALNITKNMDKTYNPLYIYGNIGTGKTHLINAIGNKILKNNPKINIIYITAEKFVYEIMNSFKKNMLNEYKNTYKTCNILIIDDLQYLSGKYKSQEEFYYIINILHEKQKQIILTSEQHPDNIINIKQKIKTKITSGLVCKITNPELKSRIKILEKKSEAYNIKLNQDILTIIAKKINTNVIALENILKLIRANSIKQKNINSINFINKLITHKKRNKKISLMNIVNIVSKFYNINIDLLISKKRNRSIVLARQIIFFLCKKLTSNSLSEIGNNLGKYNHTTVLYSYKKIKILINTNKLISKDVTHLINEIMN